jgi:hypothetical protein
MKRSFLFKIPVLILALTLTFGLIGCGGDDSNNVTPTVYTVLKITGIPSGKSILGAALTGIDEKPIAVGMNINGAFNLYEPNDNNVYPNAEKPWKGKGDFIVGLAEADPEASIEELMQGEGLTEQYIHLNFDVSAVLSAYASYDPNDKATMAGILALKENEELMDKLMNYQENMMYSFNNDNTVTLLWRNFMPVSVLQTLMGLLESMDGD